MAEIAFNAELQKDPDSSLAHLGIALILKTGLNIPEQ
jgi:hypothetical protein